jgi:transposase-like protein
MAYREVLVIEVREILRLWLDGRSLREVTRLGGVDRKTVRRYVNAAQACGLDRTDGPGQLTDELIGAVVGVVRPERPRGMGTAWEALAGQREQLAAWLAQGLTLTKVHVLLGRRGVVVSYRTLHRFAVSELGFGRKKATVRVVDGEPGGEVQVDFGRLGLLLDPVRGVRRVVHGLIFTAVYSRHMFVYPTYRQTLAEVIAGFEAAWAFFGGVFAVVVPENVPREGPVALVGRCSRDTVEVITMNPTSLSAPAGYRFPREVIAAAVRWYLRYGLSYRDVEELLAERGIEVDHVTIYRWVQAFTAEFIAAARPVRHAVGDRCFVDETYVRVAGRWTYLYRAVDQYGQVIDVLVSTRRDAAAARAFFTRALRCGPVPGEVVTDRAPVYPRVLEEMVPSARHVTERYANNAIEADHGRLKARLRPMRGFKRLASARTVSAGYAFVQNLRRGHYAITADLLINDRVRVAFDELALVL